MARGRKPKEQISILPTEGLGDLIENITSFLGIEKCDKCEKRRQKLNNVFPWHRRDIRELTEEELETMKEINSSTMITSINRNKLFQMYNSLFGVNVKPCSCPGLIRRIIGRINNVIEA